VRVDGPWPAAASGTSAVAGGEKGVKSGKEGGIAPADAWMQQAFVLQSPLYIYIYIYIYI